MLANAIQRRDVFQSISLEFSAQYRCNLKQYIRHGRCIELSRLLVSFALYLEIEGRQRLYGELEAVTRYWQITPVVYPVA